jgi:hypothetical protein
MQLTWLETVHNQRQSFLHIPKFFLSSSSSSSSFFTLFFFFFYQSFLRCHELSSSVGALPAPGTKQSTRSLPLPTAGAGDGATSLVYKLLFACLLHYITINVI